MPEEGKNLDGLNFAAAATWLKPWRDEINATLHWRTASGLTQVDFPFADDLRFF